MYGDIDFQVLSLLSSLFYVVIFILGVWFLIKFLKLKQEEKALLTQVNEKLEKLIEVTKRAD